MSIQDWFPLGLTGLISLQFKGLKSLFQLYSSRAIGKQFEGINSSFSALFIVQLSHLYMTAGKTIALTIVGKDL